MEGDLIGVDFLFSSWDFCGICVLLGGGFLEISLATGLQFINFLGIALQVQSRIVASKMR